MIQNPSIENILLEGKKILISGGTTGIGRATALLLASHGAEVFIFGRDENDLNEALNDIEKAGRKVIGTTADTSTKEGLDKVFGMVDEKWEGKLDGFINNAAIGGGNIFESEYKDWKALVDINVLGYVAFAREAADRMVKNGSGHIVNIGSMSAETWEAGAEVYNATKSAIRAFSASLRKSANKKGIKVSLIEPGSVGTDMNENPPEAQRKEQEALRMLMAEDIAQAVFYIVTQPKRVDVVMLQIRPHQQII